MINVETLLADVSVVGALFIIGTIVFAESGLLIGMFLPGDTLLFTAGFFAAQGDLPLAGVIAVIFVAAVLGDNIGYFIGKKSGPRIFRKEDGILFRSEHLVRAEKFYQKHGGKTVMLARFLPYVRTFAPMVAGAAHMQRNKFIFYNFAGALLWSVSFVLIGYWLGVKLAKQVTEYVFPAFVIVMIFALSPTILYLIRNKRLRDYIGNRIKWFWHAITLHKR